MEHTRGKYIEIDIEGILRGRLGRSARFIPRWVFRWLRRFIHEDFINEYLRQDRVGVDFCRGTLEYLDVTVDVVGEERLPADGRKYTFVSNHPLGAIDGVTLGMVLGERYDGRVKYLVNDLLMNLKGLAPLCVPVNKLGRQARNLPLMVETIFKSDDHVIMFPAGLCSRQQSDGSIRDIPWNKTFVTKSIAHKRDVVPIYFEAQNSPRFYRVARWCKRLHLPNFAMAFLPDEMYRSRGGHFRLYIGKPIPYTRFDLKERKAAEWALWVEDEVYRLKQLASCDDFGPRKVSC